MGNSQSSDDGSLIDPQCCSTRTRDRMVPTFSENPPNIVTRPQHPQQEVVRQETDETSELYGVGLVFRTTREGKLVVSSFIRDSSAFECGMVRDGDVLCAVDQMPMEGVPLDKVHHLLLGERDTWVQMRFLRQTDAKAGRYRANGDAGPRDHALGNGVEDTRWASSKMRSFAPTYDTVVVDLCRKTPSTILNEAALQAREEAYVQRTKRR